MKKLEELGISPSPWTIWNSNEKRIKDRRGYAVADLDYENTEDLQNARLIAAAPDLYEACLAALDYINEFPDSLAQDIREALEGAMEKAGGM